MNPFDDLIPKNKVAGDTGAFSDLVPTAAPVEQKQSISDKIWHGLIGIANPAGALGSYVGSSIASRTAPTIQRAGQEINEAFTAPGKTPLQQGFDASVAAAGAIPQVAADAIPGGQAAMDIFGRLAGKVSTPVLDTLSESPLIKGAAGHTTIGPQGQTNYVPNTVSAEGGLTVAKGLGTISDTILGAKAVAGGLQGAVDIAKDTTNTVRGVNAVTDEITGAKNAGPFVEQNVTGAPSPEATKIESMITPKLTARETKLALDKGRIVPGQDPTLLRSGTPDTVLPSEEIQRATKTIQERIPGAAKMKQPELYSALDRNISQTARELRPNMESVPITPDVVGGITDDWEVVKASQLADPYTPTTANIEKLQTQFETVLKESKSGTFADLWDSRIRYDASVPDSVKNANFMSSEVLQAQKSAWLQNREVLNNAIKNASNGLGRASQQAFAAMNDMYNAQEGILSSYKVVKEGLPSRVRQFAKEHPLITGTVLGGAATATGIPQKIVGAATSL